MEEFRKDQGEGEAGRKPGSRKKRRFRWIDLGIALVFLIGLCIMLYPMVSDYINRIQVAKALSDYEKTIKEITQEDLSIKRPEIELSVPMKDLEKAREILAQNGIAILKEGKEKVTLEDYYFELIGGAED